MTSSVITVLLFKYNTKCYLIYQLLYLNKSLILTENILYSKKNALL